MRRRGSRGMSTLCVRARVAALGDLQDPSRASFFPCVRRAGRTISTFVRRSRQLGRIREEDGRMEEEERG